MCLKKKKCIDAYEALEISFDVVALFQKFYCSTYLSILHQIKFSQENLYHCSRIFFFTLLPEFDGKYSAYLKTEKLEVRAAINEIGENLLLLDHNKMGKIYRGCGGVLMGP